MKQKIIIQDSVGKFEGKEEKELPPNTTLRFEVNGNQYRISFNHDTIEINKLGEKEDLLYIHPYSTNQIYIK